MVLGLRQLLYFFDQMPRLIFISVLVLCSYYSRVAFFLWKARRRPRWLDRVRGCTCSLSILLSAVRMTCTTQTVLALAWWPSSEIIRTRVCHVYYPWLLFKGGVYFVQELRIVWLLFEGCHYSSVASIQRNTVCLYSIRRKYQCNSV